MKPAEMTSADCQDILKRLGATRGGLARLLGLHPHTLARAERGGHLGPTYRLLLATAAVALCAEEACRECERAKAELSEVWAGAADGRSRPRG